MGCGLGTAQLLVQKRSTLNASRWLLYPCLAVETPQTHVSDGGLHPNGLILSQAPNLGAMAASAGTHCVSRSKRQEASHRISCWKVTALDFRSLDSKVKISSQLHLARMNDKQPLLA